jgi:tetratricopeptide (TPR) repeat protein
MKRNAMVVAMCLLLGALMASAQVTVGVPVEGTVTQEGKPFSNVQVVLTNSDNGKSYKTKTDKDGKFYFMGVQYGNFQVLVLGEKGEKLFTQTTSISAQNTTSSNILHIDVPKGGMPDAANASAPKLSKEQLAKIEADNKKIAGLNSLIKESESALQAQNWPKAEDALKQLIAAAPESSRWDFYMALGDAQAKQNKFQDAAQTFDKGIPLAQQVASGAVPANNKIPALNPASAKSGLERMLTSQANAYLKLEKPDEAIASLKKATELNPSSALTAYNLCGVEYTAGKYDGAKTDCNKYLQLEPSGAHAEEVKAFLSQMGAK